MDLTNLQIEGVSRSNYNLKNYEFSSRKIHGNRRLIHVSIPDGTMENRKHYTYDMKTINKTTINLRCYQRTPSKKRKMSINHRWEFLSTSCEDFHNLYPESQIESLLDFLLNCSSKIPEPSEGLEKDPQETESTE